jgi:hypothetical protein
MRCLALFSGGLDAQLAVRLVQEQRVEVVGLYVATALCATDGESARSAAGRLGMELISATLDQAYCDLLQRPRFGRVKFAGACLDCRIAMFAEAARRMSQLQADFVISGEVVGQRPRTAIRDLEVVAYHSGLGELLVRPLSAGLLPLSRPEERGWLDRTRLLHLQGKSRKAQRQLAAQLAIDPIPSPRPECQLLAAALGGRVLEMLHDEATLTRPLVELARFGKHHRLDAKSRVVVARNRAESEKLADIARHTSQCTLTEPIGCTGPTAAIVGEATPEARRRAAELVSQATGKPAEVH